MPASPPVIFVPPSAGSPPPAAGAVFEPSPEGKSVLTISGVSTSGINGSVIYCGLIAGKPAWSTDGTQEISVQNTLVQYISGTTWNVLRSGIYSATKASAAATPDGLTAWTVGTGSGSPVIAAASAIAPPVITV